MAYSCIHPISSFHRSDSYYDVPSTWSQTNTERDQELDDDADADFFLHEAPESVQLLFDALREGVII